MLPYPYAALAITALILIAGAGAIVDTAPDATLDAIPGASGSEPASLLPLTDRILVSEPGHRVSEFTVARSPANPEHLVVGAMDWDDQAGSIGCATASSWDAGRSWAQGEPVPGLDAPYARFDPWVTIDAQGRTHLQCMVFAEAPVIGDPTSSDPGSMLMHASSDDGATGWSNARPVPPREAGNSVDKDAIFAASDGTLYSCATEGLDLVVYQTDPVTSAWGPGKSLDVVLGLGGGFGNCNGFVESADGTVTLLWVGYLFPDAPATRFGTVATLDGGATWERATAVDELRYPEGIADRTARKYHALDPVLTWPILAVSPVSDALFVSITMQESPGEGPFIAELYRSVDAGATYQRLSVPSLASLACAGCEPSRALVAVDDAGRVGVEVVMATRDGGLTRETWLLVSEDEGDTWLAPLRLSQTGPDRSWLDARTWQPADVSPYEREATWMVEHPSQAAAVASYEAVRYDRQDHLRWGGDYWGFVGADNGFVAFWIDHYNGYPQLWTRAVAIE